MLDIVVYEDEEKFQKNATKVIEKVMNKKNIDYEIRVFNKYNMDLQNIIKKNKSKIYILDIEIADSISGIELAKRIRKNDWNSSIIMVTSHFELGYEALKAQIMLLNFISKYSNCSSDLETSLNKALLKIDEVKSLVFNFNNITYRVYTDDIVFIYKDSVDRKSIIVTEYNRIYVNDTIENIMGMLDQRFFLSHRSCIVNTLKINKVDWSNNIIYFNNGTNTDYLSRNKKKDLKEYVKSV